MPRLHVGCASLLLARPPLTAFSSCSRSQSCSPCRQLASDYERKAPLVVTTLKGATMFMADLVRAMDPCPPGLTTDYVRASSYGAGVVSSGQISFTSLGADARDRHVLVVRGGKALGGFCPAKNCADESDAGPWRATALPSSRGEPGSTGPQSRRVLGLTTQGDNRRPHPRRFCGIHRMLPLLTGRHHLLLGVADAFAVFSPRLNLVHPVPLSSRTLWTLG